MRGWWSWWRSLWSHVEHPRTLAFLRVALAVVLLVDLLEVAALDLVVPVLGDEAAGGWSDPAVRKVTPWFYDVFPPTPGSAWGLWAALVASLCAVILGVATPVSLLLVVLLYAQMALILPAADRGIDMMLRNLFLILAFSGAGRWGSVDARIRAGSIWGDGADIPAWPRHLIVLQVVVMYFTAGVQKVGYTWTPMGHFGALYILLQDAAVARMPFGWLAGSPWFQLTQIGTAVTVLWEWSAPMVLLFFHYRMTPERGGRLRQWTLRYKLHLWWLAVGVVFHLGIAATLELGLFPWAMLATYIAFVHPDEWAALWRKISRS
ncbi:MAG: hypothetical protein ACI8PZ_002506 [Myxococcota bacterium]